MSVPSVFTFETKAIRTSIDDDGAPWFNANDVCDALEMGNPSQAIKSHVDADDLQKLEVIDSLGRTQQTNHINESGLYSLILGSTKPEAKRFKKWVTSEVLPSIRKTGSYALPQMADPSLAALVRSLQELDQQRQAIAAQEKRLAQLEATTGGDACVSIMGWCSNNGLSVNRAVAAAMGKKATKACRERGIQVGRINHEMYGVVNLYPRDILDSLFGE